MKIGVNVTNMCLSWFMVWTSGYNSPRTNQGPLRRLLARGSQHCLAVCTHEMQLMIHVLIDKASLPKNEQHLEKYLEPSPAQVSNKNHVCAARRSDVSSTDSRSIDRGVVWHYNIPAHFKLNLNYLIKGFGG